MNKYVKVSAGSRARLVQQARARGFEPFDGGVQIRDRERHVMQSFAALVDKFRDDGIGLARLPVARCAIRPPAASRHGLFRSPPSRAAKRPGQAGRDRTASAWSIERTAIPR